MTPPGGRKNPEAQPMGSENAYLAHDFARFYDWTVEGDVADVAFYVETARRYGSPLLELGCGTGRLTIPLARRGFTITGIDISREMLRIAEAKLDAEPAEVRERIRLVQADMSDFQLGEAANVVFVPAASFFHLHTQEQRTSCLSSVRKHLTQAGVVVIDVLPADRMANQTVGKTDVVRSSVNPATGKMTRELNRKLSIDRRSQRVTVEHTYVETEPDGSETRHTFVQHYTWVTEEDMRRLLRETRFEDISVFGGYDLAPFSETSHRMIFVAKREAAGDIT